MGQFGQEAAIRGGKVRSASKIKSETWKDGFAKCWNPEGSMYGHCWRRRGHGVGEGTGHRCQGDGSEVRGTVLGGSHGQTTSSQLLGFRAIIKSGKPGSGI